MAGDYAPYHDEHGDHTPRAKTDPMVARIRGCVSRGGKPVAGATLMATVLPTGMSWTEDSAVTGPDGRYELIVTANHLEGRQVASIVVDGGLVGALQVEVEPGRTTDQADIEVGAGYVIRGVVRDQSGAVVPGVRVGDERFGKREETDRDGRFALRVRTTGRHRLRVFPGGTEWLREYEQGAPVIIDVDRLDGDTSGVTLVIGNEIASYGSSWTRSLPGAKSCKITPVSVRPDAPPIVHAWCIGWNLGEGGTLHEKVENSGL